MAVSDDRSFEVLRMLNPDLGDSVRVLRRLGFEGSFDELVEKAQLELEASHKRKNGRRWNPFR